MSTTTVFRAPEITARVEQLAGQVRSVVSRGLSPRATAEAVAARLAGHLWAPNLLTAEQCVGDPDGYRQHLLYAEHDGSFSIVALVWLPGHATPVHDHVAWCATGVHRGQETERRYRLVPGSPARLVATAELVSPQGTVSGFAPPGDIHEVWNGSAHKAISLHVYGADISRIGSSVRRVYEIPLAVADGTG